jgi:glycosyltransferase involved in cell wall biosynthesis
LFAVLLLLRAPFYDIVFLHRLPLPHWYAYLLHKISDDLIYDFDDAQYTDPAWRDSTNGKQINLDRTLEIVSAVISGSPILANYASELNRNTFCIPTGIPKEQYQRYWGCKRDSDTVVIGWIGHPDNLYYLKKIDVPIRVILNKYDNVHLNIITKVNSKEDIPLSDRLGDDVHYIEWSLETELDDLSNINIGIRPLIDDEWTRAKGGFTSVIQCMALEIPVIVTPVGMLTDIVHHNISGYHATTNDEWIQHMSELVEHSDLRDKTGKKSREQINQLNFWTEQRAAEVIDKFKKIKEHHTLQQ